MDGVSIVLNLYQPKKEVLEKILKSFEKQDIESKIELVVVDKKTNEETKDFIKSFFKKSKKIKLIIIKVNENLNFASSMNVGIKKAKNNRIVVIQQDCIPVNESWLNNLIEPFRNREVVATVSRVRFPDELWNQLNIFAKAIMTREKGVITPLLDEKACAYRKDILNKTGLFNDRDFKTAGEDFDIYLKLKNCGIIAYPDAEVTHYHPINFKSRLSKVKQYANGFGTLVRMHKKRMPHWYIGLFKATPIIGIIPFILGYPIKKAPLLYPVYILLTPVLHYLYVKGFWKGYVTGSQSIDVFKSK